MINKEKVFEKKNLNNINTEKIFLLEEKLLISKVGKIYWFNQ